MYISDFLNCLVGGTEGKITDDNEKRLIVLKRGVNLQTLVDGINALGVGPRDLIAILQTVKAAGALQAELVVQ